jgi:5-formyltetrahydrofolate cyclo-ligase
MNKSDLRAQVKNIVLTDKNKKGAKIVNAILNLPQFLHAKSVGLFMALGNEPCLKQVLDHCFLQNKQVFLPVTTSEIKLSVVTKDTLFEKKKFGVFEPCPPKFINELPEIIFVPMVAYDKNLNRLGHGKGYYDKFLANKQMLKIGVCFSDFQFDAVPTDVYDVKMDIIACDEGIM